MKLKAGPLGSGKRAKIFNQTIPLGSILIGEVAEINKRNNQKMKTADTEAIDTEAVDVEAIELDAIKEMDTVKEMEKRRAKEISEGRLDIVANQERRDTISNQERLNKESILQPELPVYIRTPRMLITGNSMPASKLRSMY
jgi:hypothetical protein